MGRVRVMRVLLRVVWTCSLCRVMGRRKGVSYAEVEEEEEKEEEKELGDVVR